MAMGCIVPRRRIGTFYVPASVGILEPLHFAGRLFNIRVDAPENVLYTFGAGMFLDGFQRRGFGARVRFTACRFVLIDRNIYIRLQVQTLV